MQPLIIDSSMNLCQGIISLSTINDETDVDNTATDVESEDEEDEE